MSTENKTAAWSGRVLTTLAALPFVFSFIMKFSGNPQVLQGVAHLGWPETMIVKLGVLEAICVLLYLIPPTSVLGGIVLTGYLGGAIATHLRIGEPVTTHIVIGLLIWLGLFLREPRLHVLLPIRSKDFSYVREITINRPHHEVFAYLKPLKNFRSWNPFLKADPQTRLEFQGTDGQPGFVASWEGNGQVGAGEQEITRILDGRRIDFELRFKKPFRATNQGYWAAEALPGDQTRVSWCMSGKTPFPMSLFGLFMNCEKMIGSQFEAGLSELKALLEK